MMTETRLVNLFDLFTIEELEKACKLDSVKEILQEIVTAEKLEHINKVTQQQNDRTYFAYVLLNYKLQTQGKL